jgi:elongation factor P--beta-lysine ligase
VPVQFILTEWYQALRRTHEANDHWPTDLGSVLSAWVQKQDLPAQIKRLSQITYSDAVTYLPIFMAYVTAGKAQLDDLRLNTAYLKFAIKMLSDFDRSTWYNCVHAMMVSYLLASDARG